MAEQSKPNASEAISALVEVMAKLRSPEGGCPWDLEQNFQTIAPYTVEEAYEVADAIERNDMPALRDELGDLLFQAVFHAQIAKENDLFDFADVAQAIADKMIRRHPHVFGDEQMRNSDQQTIAWEDQKAAEREAKGQTSILADVPVGLPGLTRAVKLQKRAARVGFDWADATSVLAKITEETQELVQACENAEPDQIEDEFGDLLFIMANLSRHLKVDPEAALRRTNEKFVRRFRYIEDKLGTALPEADLSQMEALWQEAKLAAPRAK